MKAWHFSAGETLRVKCPPMPCMQGSHASVKLRDALSYAAGPYLWRVEIAGDVVHGNGKLAATECTALWGFDATDMLRRFARLCALDVVHLWDAPVTVMQYLRTGDENLRAAARDAAFAAFAALEDSDYVAAKAAHVAHGAASTDAAAAATHAAAAATTASAYTAPYAYAAANAAARAAAAYYAARKAQNQRLTTMAYRYAKRGKS